MSKKRNTLNYHYTVYDTCTFTNLSKSLKQGLTRSLFWFICSLSLSSVDCNNVFCSSVASVMKSTDPVGGNVYTFCGTGRKTVMEKINVKVIIHVYSTCNHKNLVVFYHCKINVHMASGRLIDYTFINVFHKFFPSNDWPRVLLIDSITVTQCFELSRWHVSQPKRTETLK